jgi:hypothetical protein
MHGWRSVEMTMMNTPTWRYLRKTKKHHAYLVFILLSILRDVWIRKAMYD